MSVVSYLQNNISSENTGHFLYFQIEGSTAIKEVASITSRRLNMIVNSCTEGCFKKKKYCDLWGYEEVPPEEKHQGLTLDLIELLSRHAISLEIK